VIAGFRNRLLAEHLGTEEAALAEAIERHGGLVRGIESLNHGPRLLVPVEPEETWLMEIISDRSIFDPERPVTLEQLEVMLAPQLPAIETGRELLRPALAVLAVLALAAVWALTPMRDWLTADRVVALAQPFRMHPLGPLLWVSAFVGAGLLLIPLTVLITASALLFGPWLGVATAAAGSITSGIAGYLLGRWLWRDTVRRVAGDRVNRISREIGKRGVMSVVALRLLPIAPYTLVNLVAGASHVGLRDFIVGTIIGLTPGIIGLSIVADRAINVLTNPDVGSVMTLVAVALAFVAGLAWLRRSLGASINPEPERSG
jgi:uncharacterized membrane protein YdjX (TVP38/TMEM64 family)